VLIHERRKNSTEYVIILFCRESIKHPTYRALPSINKEGIR